MGKKKGISIIDLNHLYQGEFLEVDKDLRIRRIYGGFMYEYLSSGKVVAAAFVSTDELRTD
jgi:hypothetical protein